MEIMDRFSCFILPGFFGSGLVGFLHKGLPRLEDRNGVNLFLRNHRPVNPTRFLTLRAKRQDLFGGDDCAQRYVMFGHGHLGLYDL